MHDYFYGYTDLYVSIFLFASFIFSLLFKENDLSFLEQLNKCSKKEDEEREVGVGEWGEKDGGRHSLCLSRLFNYSQSSISERKLIIHLICRRK